MSMKAQALCHSLFGARRDRRKEFVHALIKLLTNEVGFEIVDNFFIAINGVPAPNDFSPPREGVIPLRLPSNWASEITF
jgi:hypothetical protein